MYIVTSYERSWVCGVCEGVKWVELSNFDLAAWDGGGGGGRSTLLAFNDLFHTFAMLSWEALLP